MAVSVSEIFPPGWRGYFAPENGRIGIGIDLATTTKRKSNPSALAITQQVGLMYYVRLLIKWKTDQPAVTRAIIDHALQLPHGLKVGQICIDATNERYFATDLRTYFAGRVPVTLVINSEAISYLGESMLVKAYLGNLLVNTIVDGYLALPDEEWVKNDFRQVVSSRGTFSADVDADGNHADGFDAVANSLHALQRGNARVEAHAASVGTSAHHDRPGIKNPLSRLNRFVRRNSC